MTISELDVKMLRTALSQAIFAAEMQALRDRDNKKTSDGWLTLASSWTALLEKIK